jgi:AraC-like DNA-binding protein/nucleoside-triphosphatase THEP1
MNSTIYSDQAKNEIRFSQIKKIDGEVKFAGFGVKYVASGEETYIANNKKYLVKQGEYIIGNDFTSSIVQINQPETVQGLCIDVAPSIISEVAQFHDKNGTDLTEFLLSDQFFVNKYKSKNTTLGYTLSEINRKIINGTITNELQRDELFYSIAESIIVDQRFVFEHLNKLEFKKEITNEEILRSLLLAKDYMDENILANPDLEQICSVAGISKYHFIRLFKNTFGVSPYQYLKKKRLLACSQAIASGLPIIEVSFQFGFGTPQSFSKAFKQEFGYSPGKLLKKQF